MVYRCFYRDLPPVGFIYIDTTDCQTAISIEGLPTGQYKIHVILGNEVLPAELFNLPTLEDDPTPREKCQCIFTIGYNVGVARLAAIDPDEIF